MSKINYSIIILLSLLISPNIYGLNNFKLQNKATRTIIQNNCFYSSDSLVISDIGNISGFSISGEIRKTSPEYVIRVVLTDSNNKEYLVMESYEEINSDSIFTVNGFCEETSLLDNVVPFKLKVFLKDASFKLTNMSFSGSSKKSSYSSKLNNSLREEIRRNQTESIINRINAYNRSHNKLWVAGESSLSKMDYETKKRLLGLNDSVSSGGWEYYVDGIFEIGHTYPTYRDTTSIYVPDFDWRNRHGINWMTPVKDQWNSHFCVAFATLSCLEALVNMYFNKKIDLDLSEQELASCSGVTPHGIFDSLDEDSLYDYITNHGVCDEDSYPFLFQYNTVPCVSDNIETRELVKFSSSEYLINNTSDGYKSAIINNGPLNISLYSGGIMWHALSLVGYHTIREGDVIYESSNGLSDTNRLIIQEGDPRIGQTYWVFKDSKGENKHMHGYRYVLFNNPQSCPDAYFTTKFMMPITRLGYSNSDIVWEDRDGDGYFNWGIGNRPASMPSWVPWKKDGDDSDATKGMMDEFGFCEDLTESISDTLFISQDGYMYGDYERNIKITGGAKVSFYGNMMFQRGASITVDEFSTLELDGGKLRNVEIKLKPKSNLVIKNGGEIYLRRNTSLDIPISATAELSDGSIFNRPY